MISIVIPTYNRNKILCDTIDKVLEQNFHDFELLIIDQTAKHDEYTTEFLSQLPLNTKIIKTKTPNLPAARNIGIKNSIGDIIVFIDDDMSIPKDTLTKVVSAFNDESIFALTGFMQGTSTLAGYFHKKRIANKYHGTPLIKIKHLLGGFMCFRKSIFDFVGFFDEWIGEQPTASGEDLEFSLRILRKGYSLHLDRRIVIEHVGRSIIEGGCDKSSLSFEENKYWQMRNNLYIQFKNRKFSNVYGSVLAFWKVYRGSILNSSIIKKDIKKLIAEHKNIYKLAKEIIPHAQVNEY